MPLAASAQPARRRSDGGVTPRRSTAPASSIISRPQGKAAASDTPLTPTRQLRRSPSPVRMSTLASASDEEASALEAALLQQAVAHAVADGARGEALRQSQEGFARLQAQVRILRETTQALSAESSAAAQRQLAAHTERLTAESGAALEGVRSQMEEELYLRVAAHERDKVALDEAQATVVERDATIAELRRELDERRDAMAKLHYACHRHSVVTAASTPRFALTVEAAQPPTAEPAAPPAGTVACREAWRLESSAQQAADPTAASAEASRLERPPQMAAAEGRSTGAAACGGLACGGGSCGGLACGGGACGSGACGGAACGGAACGGAARAAWRACALSANESGHVQAMAAAELERRLALAQAGQALGEAGAREEAAARAQAALVAAQEEREREATAREALWKAELRAVEHELGATAGVESALRQAVRQLDGSDAQAAQMAREVERVTAAHQLAERKVTEVTRRRPRTSTRCPLPRRVSPRPRCCRRPPPPCLRLPPPDAAAAPCTGAASSGSGDGRGGGRSASTH